MPFRSQAQWQWAFANKKPWASEWAKETPRKFSDLPAYSKKATTTGNFSATAGQVIGGNQCRDAQGKFVNCDELQSPSNTRNSLGSMADYMQSTEVSRIIENERRKLLRKQIRQQLGLETTSSGGSSSRAISPAERKRQQREEQKRNEMEAHDQVGPGSALGAALSAFADPENPRNLPNVIAYQLEELGLVSPSRFGSYYITGEGRAYLGAARSGDLFAAQEAMMRARESFLGKQEQYAAQQQQMYEDAAAQQQAAAEQAYIESIEGTPFERRVRLAMKRREQMQQSQSGGGKKPAASSSSPTYGSGKVIAGSPKKSTTKSFEEDSSMKYNVPTSVLTNMIIGRDYANHYSVQHEVGDLVDKAINGESFSIHDMRRLKSYQARIDPGMGSREEPTPAWIRHQMVGGIYGYRWADQALSEFEHEMSRYKEKSDEDPRVPSLSASTEAIRGLDLQFYFKRGGNPSAIAIARKIANRKPLSDEDIREMHSYLERHTNDRKEGWANPADPSKEYINWQLYGGDAGLSWSSEALGVLNLKKEKLSDELSLKSESSINFSPPQGVRSAARRGLELRSKFGRGGTSVGIARARDLSNGKSLSPTTIRRMRSFFARHAVDKRPGWSDPSKPSNGYIAHLLWGGDAGRAWSAKVDRQLDARERKKEFAHPISKRMQRIQAMKSKNNKNHEILQAVQMRERTKSKNTPTNPSLWKQAVAEAKKKYNVYPSAYANGYAARWYKQRGGKWKTEKDLRSWFNEDWVDISRPKKGGGFEPCGRKTEGMSKEEYRKRYPKCVPAKRAAQMSKQERDSAIQRKRRSGLPKNGAPTLVSTIISP